MNIIRYATVFFILIISCMCLGTSFSQEPQLEEVEFATERGFGPRGEDGPWLHQIKVAISKDGYNWEKTDAVIGRQISVPDALVGRDGKVYLYFVDFYNEGMTVGISEGAGADSFKFYRVIIDGRHRHAGVDPDVVQLDDGTFLLYYFNPPPPEPGRIGIAGGIHQIFVAASKDGVNFHNPRLAYEDENITDPDVVKIGDRWFMYVARGPKTIYAASSDGMEFERIGELDFFGSVTSTIRFDGGYRIFYHRFRPDKGLSIYSAYSQYGIDWDEEGIMIDRSGDIKGVADPTVVKLRDGSYKMYYKTWIE